MTDSTAFNNMIDNPEGPTPSDSVPLIVGASIGGLCCILLTALLITWIVRRRQLNASNNDSKSEYFDSSLAETAEVSKNSISIYAAMPQIDTPDVDDTNTSQIVYGVAPTDVPSQSQIYGAAPPMMNT